VLGDLDYERWPIFLKNNPVEYYKAIIDNIIRINDAGGIAQLSTELINLRDAGSTEDGLTKWYNEL
ncbi:MAG TPA: hypothetical protein DCG32_04485, partial [Sphaerochaeta sp.]|nr:hypothetical protein [Sphaerochaeta sp.]